MVDFIKKRLTESLTYSLIESLLDEEYPTNFDREHFKTLKSFNQRVKYCEENLERISSGSSRIVYKIDNEKVLKLAKNKKGLAQNETEMQWGGDSYYDHILAHTFDSDPNGLWVEMELARKVTASNFKKITGVDIYDLKMYLTNFYLENNGRKKIYTIDPLVVEELNENQFAQDLSSFMMDTDSPAGDLTRVNSYGLVKRNGVDDIVLIDFGLTGDIYSSYYS